MSKINETSRQFEETGWGIDGCTKERYEPNHDWELADTADDWALLRCRQCGGEKWFEPKEWNGDKEMVCRQCRSFESDCGCSYCDKCGRNMSYMTDVYKEEMECDKCGNCFDGCCDGKCEE